MVRCRRSMEEAAARVFMARSYCAGVKVGTTAAAPSGLGSKSVSTPLLDTSAHFSTCSGSRLSGTLNILLIKQAASHTDFYSPSRHLVTEVNFIAHIATLPTPNGPLGLAQGEPMSKQAEQRTLAKFGSNMSRMQDLARESQMANSGSSMLRADCGWGAHPVGAALNSGAPGTGADGVARTRVVCRLRRQRLHDGAHVRGRCGRRRQRMVVEAAVHQHRHQIAVLSVHLVAPQLPRPHLRTIPIPEPLLIT